MEKRITPGRNKVGCSPLKYPPPRHPPVLRESSRGHLSRKWAGEEGEGPVCPCRANPKPSSWRRSGWVLLNLSPQLRCGLAPRRPRPGGTTPPGEGPAAGKRTHDLASRRAIEASSWALRDTGVGGGDTVGVLAKDGVEAGKRFFSVYL